MKTVNVEVKDKKGQVLESVPVEQCESHAEALQKFGEVGLVKLANSAHRNQMRNKAALKYKPATPKVSLTRVADRLAKGEITHEQAQAMVNEILSSVKAA